MPAQTSLRAGFPPAAAAADVVGLCTHLSTCEGHVAMQSIVMVMILCKGLCIRLGLGMFINIYWKRVHFKTRVQREAGYSTQP